MGRLPLSRQIALKSFLKRYHGNGWMQVQDGWLENASLTASCELNEEILDVSRVLYCIRCGLRCEQPNLCRRCCLDRRVQPALDEYGRSFDHAPHWYAAVLGLEIHADRAGVHFGDLDHRPFTGRPDGHILWACPEQEQLFERLCRALFTLPTFLKDHGVISGAFSHLEFHLSIRPGQSSYDFWSGTQHALKPHLHILLNAPAPITSEMALAIHSAFGGILMFHRAAMAYPNLWFVPVPNQKELNGWLRYTLKPWPLALWYRRALKRGCDPLHLNLLFDELVFVNLAHLARRVVSPRKIGNLNCQSKDGYIGIQPPMRLPWKLATRWLTDPNFAAQHPDWEESIYQMAEKRRQRRGRRSLHSATSQGPLPDPGPGADAPSPAQEAEKA